MSSIRKSITIAVSPAAAWSALRDFGGLRALAPGFVTECRLDGDVRHVTFASGASLTERLVGIDDVERRIVWTIIDGPYAHHNGAARVWPDGDGTVFEWTTDVLPDELAAPTAAAMERGLAAIKEALES